MRKISYGIAVAQGLALAIYAVSLLVTAIQVDSEVGSPISETIIYLIFAALILLVARGFNKGQSWARTPYLVIQLFLGIVAYTLFVGSGASYKVSGVILGATVVVGIIGLFKTPIES